MLHDEWWSEASEAEREAAQCVVNLDDAKVTCPACQHSFERGEGAVECPDCGLVIG